MLAVHNLTDGVLFDLRIYLLVRLDKSYVEVEGFNGLLLCQVREHGQPGGVELGGCESSLVLNVVQRYQLVDFFLAIVQELSAFEEKLVILRESDCLLQVVQDVAHLNLCVIHLLDF